MTDFSNETASRAYNATEPAGTRSIGEVLGDLTRDLSTLVQQELALAKAELKQSASKLGQSIGMYAGAALAAFFFVLFLTISLWWAIGNGTGRGWAALIVAAIWLVIGIVLALVARTQLKKIRGLEQTAGTLSEVPNALKGQEERNR